MVFIALVFVQSVALTSLVGSLSASAATFKCPSLGFGHWRTTSLQTFSRKAYTHADTRLFAKRLSSEMEMLLKIRRLKQMKEQGQSYQNFLEEQNVNSTTRVAASAGVSERDRRIRELVNIKRAREGAIEVMEFADIEDDDDEGIDIDMEEDDFDRLLRDEEEEDTLVAAIQARRKTPQLAVASASGVSVSPQRYDEEAIMKDLQSKADNETYVPKVSTWGIFPRPQNISKAFGGGRTIRNVEGAPAMAAVKPASANPISTLEATEDSRDIEARHVEDIERARRIAKAQTRIGMYSTAVEVLVKVEPFCSYYTKLGGETLLELAMAYDFVRDQASARRIYAKLAQSSPIMTVKDNARKLVFTLDAYNQVKDLLKPADTAFPYQMPDWSQVFTEDRYAPYVSFSDDVQKKPVESFDDAYFYISLVAELSQTVSRQRLSEALRYVSGMIDREESPMRHYLESLKKRELQCQDDDNLYSCGGNLDVRQFASSMITGNWTIRARLIPGQTMRYYDELVETREIVLQDSSIFVREPVLLGLKIERSGRVNWSRGTDEDLSKGRLMEMAMDFNEGRNNFLGVKVSPPGVVRSQVMLVTNVVLVTRSVSDEPGAKPVFDVWKRYRVL